MFKNESGKVIYVGKAIRLYDRVKSYFVIAIDTSSKTAALVRQIVDLDTIEVETELEALILEASLIKKHNPKYNVALKDDKSSLHIVIRNEEVKINGKPVKLPVVITARATELKPNDKIYGPYAHGTVAKYLLRTLRRMFPFRDCSTSKFQRYQGLGSPCFYGHVGLCPAPCTNAVSIEEYKAQVKQLQRLLEGESPRLLGSLEKEMRKLSKEMKYEEAAQKRDLLSKINYITRNFRDPEEYMDNPYLIEDLVSQALDELVANIPELKRLPSRIECYDISNLFGKDATGSMVVATDGRIDKSEYRKFRIKFKETPDDFEMIREVLRRRFAREKLESKNMKKWGTPDLIVIDGGKGQVSAAVEVLQKLGLSIPIIGLAKRLETIVLSGLSEVSLSKDNAGLKLLQRLRDEAHRFAKKYHMQLRLRKIGSGL